MEWPNDADGGVFRSLQDDGFDFEKECSIDFNIDFDHWPLDEKTVKEIRGLYPQCRFINPDEEDLADGTTTGYVQFQVSEKLTYDLVMETQKRVTHQMNPIGGWCESWGVVND